MNTKHTPGPWFAHGRAILNSASRRGDGCRQVADISDMPSSEMTVDELQANARLVAAAPELLAALQLAYRHLNGGSESLSATEHATAFKLARAAIASAT